MQGFLDLLRPCFAFVAGMRWVQRLRRYPVEAVVGWGLIGVAASSVGLCCPGVCRVGTVSSERCCHPGGVSVDRCAVVGRVGCEEPRLNRSCRWWCGGGRVEIGRAGPAALTRRRESVGVINGVPAHVLLVHAVVVLVPLTALAMVVCAVWPQVMRRFGVALPLLAMVSLIAVPLATDSGEWLQERVAETSQVERHTEMGDEILPWAVGLLVLAAALWFAYRRAEATVAPTPAPGAASASVGTRLRVVAVVLCMAVSAGAIVQVYRVGDSGAKAAWQGKFSSTSGQQG